MLQPNNLKLNKNIQLNKTRAQNCNCIKQINDWGKTN